MGMIYLLSVLCAFCVANIYYSQTILVLIAQSLHISYGDIGNIPTIVQLAYASGLFFLVPLGDKLNRKTLLQWLFGINLAASVAAFFSHSLLWLELANFIIGMTAVGAQIMIPAAPAYVSRENVGKAVGILLSGLLTGVLFARLLAGYMGEWLGWQAVYAAAALLNLVSIGVIYAAFPTNEANPSLSYPQLLQSTCRLFLTEKELRRSCLSGFLIFGAYSSLWGNIAGLTSRAPFFLSSHEVGLLGLSGITGIIISPYIGRLADKYNPGFVVALGSSLTFAGFLILYYSIYSLLILLLSMIVLDMSARHSLIGNQLRTFALDQQARSRLNTVFMTSYFLGGAVGTKAGIYWSGLYSWTGLTILGCSLAAISLLLNWRSFLAQK